MSDVDLHVTHLVASGVVRAYKLGDVPASPPYPYAVLTLNTGTARARGLDMKAGKTYRLSVQMFGREHDSVTDLAGIADEAFDGTPLDYIDGYPVSVRELSTDPYRDPDDLGVLNVLHTYRY